MPPATKQAVDYLKRTTATKVEKSIPIQVPKLHSYIKPTSIQQTSTSTTMLNPLVLFLTMDFPYATETVCIFMAIQGSMSVRNGPNKNGQMHWFHSFLRSTLTAYAGASFTNIFMGKPTAMFANDVFFGSCIIGYGIVNWLPKDIGYHFFNTSVGTLLHTVFSQVFRVGGVCGFSDAAMVMFKDAPSIYYPTPIFGPILFPTLLGNIGGFVWNGFDDYLSKGMPWLFQQGLSCSTFYHFYAHDVEGGIGIKLRSIIKPVATQIMLLLGADEKESLDDALFAKFLVGFFMIFMAIVRLPMIWGPKFSPFTSGVNAVKKVFGGGKKKRSDIKPPGSVKKSKKKNQ